MAPRSNSIGNSLHVTVSDGSGRPVRVPGLARWLSQVVEVRRRSAVAVALVPDRRMKALNARFRGVNRATDVLSFSAETGEGAIGAPAGRSSVAHELGDVVIASGVAARQARAAGHGLSTELRILALHGVLHLLGYDHEIDAGRMARAERRLRRRGGLEEGLIERSGRRSTRGTDRRAVPVR